jgi:hypothetical protein
MARNRLPAREVATSAFRTCCRCGCDSIVWCRSTRTGGWYMTEARREEDGWTVARNWFHDCDAYSASHEDDDARGAAENRASVERERREHRKRRQQPAAAPAARTTRARRREVCPRLDQPPVEEPVEVQAATPDTGAERIPPQRSDDDEAARAEALMDRWAGKLAG